MLLALCNQVICLIPALVVLTRYFGVDGVWYSFVASAVMSCAVSLAALAAVKCPRIAVK